MWTGITVMSMLIITKTSFSESLMNFKSLSLMIEKKKKSPRNISWEVANRCKPGIAEYCVCDTYSV